MQQFLRILQLIWATLSCSFVVWLPLHLIWWPLGIIGIGLLLFYLYGLHPVASLFKQIKFVRWDGVTPEYVAVEGNWVHRTFLSSKWAGGCLGWAIWYNPKFVDAEKTNKHERRHAEQFRKFGVFLPLIYATMVVFIYFLMKDRHPYYDCWFEWDSRKAAGQPLEIPWQQWANSNDRWVWWAFILVTYGSLEHLWRIQSFF